MSDILVLSDSEKKIIEQIRNLRPYEHLNIMADVEGRPGSFVLTRTSKVVLIVNKPNQYLRPRLQGNE